MRDTFLLAALLLLGGTLSPAAAHVASDTIYVDTDASGAEDGSSWTDAYTSLQDGLNAARSNGTADEVWVAGGIYYPDEGASVQSGDRAESFQIESRIDLRGHFSGDEESLGERTLARDGPKTILSGEIQQDGSASNNAYTVLRITGGSAGEVHIKGGAANGSGAQRRGGGAHVSGGALHHAVFTGNRAGRGAALLITQSPSLDVLQVTGNHATGSGALYFNGDASTVEHLTVADNTADDGPTGLYFIESDAALEDVAAGSNASSAVAERIPVTFNTKTVGDTLYTGDDYGETLTYQVSTDDTTFTATGGESANIPLKDGDNLEINHSDPAYINTFVANNTDTELPPHQVSGFPDEPDYQSNTKISIPKSNVVNEYQIAGIPDTSPEGYSTIDDWAPHFEDSDVRRWTELAGYDSLSTFIQEGHPGSWENKASTVVPEVQSFMPIPINGPEYVTDSELQGIFDQRGDNNITRFDRGPASAGHFYSGDYLKNTSGKFSDSDILGTVRSEVYNAFTGFDETGNNYVTNKILDANNEFISSEASFPINIVYNTKSLSNIE